MSRQPNGQGSIRQRADGKWEASIRLGGSRHWARGKTRADVQRALNELRRAHAADELRAPSRITVGEHLRDWLDANRGQWRPSTTEGYELVIRKHIVPALGSRRLQSLTPADLAKAYARWRDAGVGQRTLAILHSRLHRALRQAVLWGRIGRNPADSVEPPRSEYRRPTMWTPEEAKVCVGGLDSCTWHGALTALLLGGGLRLGEALGLRWGDIDLSAGTIRIERTRVHLPGRVVEGPPKTGAGVRALTLPPFVLESLRRWRLTQAEERLASGPDWRGEALVFTTADGNGPTRRQARYWLDKHTRTLGLPHMTPHGLRHLSASLALSAGIPIVDVSRHLGHANVAITASTYAHSLRKDDAHIASAIERAMGVG